VPKEVQKKQKKKPDSVNHKSKDKIQKKTSKSKSKLNLKKYLTKENIIYLLIALIDITIIIYVAKKNIINYVTIDNNKPIYLGDKHNLFLGRNYITLVTTIVVYLYILTLNKFYFKKKINIKYLILILFLILILNCIIFYLFTNKVY